MLIFGKKSFSAMRLTFVKMASLNSKLSHFRKSTSYYSDTCIHKVTLFGPVFGLRTSSDHSSLNWKRGRSGFNTYRDMIINLFCLSCIIWMWTICLFNVELFLVSTLRYPLLATQLISINYCLTRLILQTINEVHQMQIGWSNCLMKYIIYSKKRNENLQSNEFRFIE